jgi:hypothetical protein
MRRRERTTRLFGDETRSFDQGLPEQARRRFIGCLREWISDHIISVIECIPTCYKMLPSVYVKHGAASHYRKISVGQRLMEDESKFIEKTFLVGFGLDRWNLVDGR